MSVHNDRGRSTDDDDDSNNGQETRLCCGQKPSDRCRCTGCCRYPNGFRQILAVQTFLLCAVLFSVATMCDCRFVESDLSEQSPNYAETPSFLPLKNSSTLGYGWVFYEGENGGCFWNKAYDGSQVDEYFDYFGHDWLGPRAVGFLAAIFGILEWIWCLWLNCLSHTRPMRYFLAGMNLLVIVPFQLSTFSVCRSDFCDAYGCALARSAGFSIVAALFYTTVGVLLFRLNDFPGTTESKTNVTVYDDIEMVAVAAMANDESTGQEDTLDDCPLEATVLDGEPIPDGIGDVEEVTAAISTVSDNQLLVTSSHRPDAAKLSVDEDDANSDHDEGEILTTTSANALIAAADRGLKSDVPTHHFVDNLHEKDS